MTQTPVYTWGDNDILSVGVTPAMLQVQALWAKILEKYLWLWGALPVSTALLRPSGVARRCWFGTQHWTLGGRRWDAERE